jgi:hypothetical protein
MLQIIKPPKSIRQQLQVLLMSHEVSTKLGWLEENHKEADLDSKERTQTPPCDGLARSHNTRAYGWDIFGKYNLPQQG